VIRLSIPSGLPGTLHSGLLLVILDIHQFMIFGNGVGFHSLKSADGVCIIGDSLKSADGVWRIGESLKSADGVWGIGGL